MNNFWKKAKELTFMPPIIHKNECAYGHIHRKITWPKFYRKHDFITFQTWEDRQEELLLCQICGETRTQSTLYKLLWDPYDTWTSVLMPQLYTLDWSDSQTGTYDSLTTTDSTEAN